jgi:hypothetical protein
MSPVNFDCLVFHLAKVERRHPVATARGSVTSCAFFAGIVRLTNFVTNALDE